MSGFLHGIETVEIDSGLRPIQTVRSAVIGIVGTAPAAVAARFPLDTPVLIAGSRTEAAALGTTGTLPRALDGIFDQAGAVVVVIRVAEGSSEAETLSAVIGGVDAATEARTGLQALLDAQGAVGQVPRLIVAPGFSQNAAVATELVAIAGRLRGIAIIDGPDSTDADAIAAIAGMGSDRAYLVDPWVKVWDTVANAHAIEPPSARVAGLIAKMDAEKGFWWSPSNQEIAGIVGTSRQIDFNLYDGTSRGQLLNAAKVATIAQVNGWRLMGNRTATVDPNWAFLSVRRTADMVYESVEKAHQWALDRPFSAQLLRDIRDGVAAYLRSLEARGALLGSRVWIDEELNTEATLKAGQLFIDFDLEPPAPLERLTFRAHRNGDYYEELIAAVGSTQE